MTEALADSRIAPDRLASAATSLLVAVGVPEADAAVVADSLLAAERWGHPSHGVLRLTWYVARIRAGVVDPGSPAEALVDKGAVSLVDGRDGLGQVLATRAAIDATRRAHEHGIGLVGIRNSNHFGTARYYTRLMAERGCIGIVATNSSASMAPWGGRVKAIGNDPWSIAAPAGRFGYLVTDMANTQVARGKIYIARQRGLPIPEGWALDEDGLPTTDPVRAAVGMLAPMGGHKGYAISMAMEMLTGILTGSAFAPDVVGPHVPDRRSGAGHLLIAIDIATFIEPSEFAARTERLIERMKAVPLAPGFDEILFPGELEDRAAERADREGINVPAKTIEELTALARELGVAVNL